MFGETENYHHKITLIRRHAFQFADFDGYIVEGISQLKADEEYIFIFSCQTDLHFDTFYSECIRRYDDHYLNRQGIRNDRSSTFVETPDEVKLFVKTLDENKKKYIMSFKKDI